MITAQTLLLTCSSVLILLLHLSQTTRAVPYTSRHGCSPSACGIIRNISSPFRLKHDPKHCGHHEFELACENNITSIIFNSQKYYVKAINYHNETIRLVDASIMSNNDTCSFPNSSAYAYNFTPKFFYHDSRGYPYRLTRDYSSYHYVAWPINFMRCPTPLKNFSFFTDITHDCASKSSSHVGYSTYVKVGRMNASEVPQMCGLEVIVMTSWKKFQGLNNSVSLSEIHHSLLYGFELIFCSHCIKTKWDKYWDFFYGKLHGDFVILPVILVLVSAVVGPSVMIIIVFTGVLGFFAFCFLKIYLYIPFVLAMLLIGQ